MKWSILILTMPERKQFLDRLLQALYPQIEDHQDIEIITRTSDKSLTIGANRESLKRQARGEYLNFIDDDDMIPKNYVESIYPLLDGVDYVGFPVRVTRDGVFYGIAYHSLQHKQWTAHGDTSFRDISHLNPIKRNLAIQAEMEGDYGEDHRWAVKMRELGIVKTQHYIPQPMYFYHMRTKKEEMQPCV